MSENKVIEEAPMCFACGQSNPIGLKIKFTLNDNIVKATFRPNENHVGYQDTVHGGIIFAALDDVMANVLYLQNIKAFTARCEVRYRKALQAGQTINLKGWIENERRRLYTMKGEARLAENDAVIADAEASFMRL
ncbi:MAG: thioesterase [Woeseia sp.]|nr:thioesterase [Woeseia sp.]